MNSSIFLRELSKYFTSTFFFHKASGILHYTWNVTALPLYKCMPLCSLWLFELGLLSVTFWHRLDIGVAARAPCRDTATLWPTWKRLYCSFVYWMRCALSMKSQWFWLSVKFRKLCFRNVTVFFFVLKN